MNDTKLRPGDHVIMVGCMEAKHHEGEVWEVESKPWIYSSGTEVALLKGFSGGFSTEYLQRTDLPLYRKPAPLNKEFISFEKIFRAIQQISQEEFVTAVMDFFGGKDRDYAEGCWSQFCQSPIGYIYSRAPLEQGEMLFKLAQQKAQSADIHDRCFSVVEKAYRRFREELPREHYHEQTR